MTTATAIAPSLLTRRIRDLLQAGRPAAARPLVAALRRVAPDAGETGEIEGRLLLQEDRVSEAIAVLDGAIAAVPGHAGLHLCRAEARLRADDPPGAAMDAADAVLATPGSAQAKAVLGIVMNELGHTEDARACLAEAVAAEPACAAFRQGLAEVLQRGGDPAAAAATLAEGMAAAPADLGLRIAAILAAMQRRDFIAAIAIAADGHRAGVSDARSFGLLGHALSSLARHPEAVDAYAEALKLAPEDAYVRHLVATAGRLCQSPRAPSAYLETVFDGYAERFEAHLIAIGYRVPGLVRAALLRNLQPGAIGAVLDLGCGTGLIGVALSDQPIGPLTGIDISTAMLQQAAAKGLYAELIQGDLEAVLAAETRCWPIIIAGDVFCYFGELASILQAAAQRLSRGGLLIFSVERLAEDDVPWQLGETGRYAHGRNGIIAAAAQAGLTVRSLAADDLRMEQDVPVPGLLAVLERAA